MFLSVLAVNYLNMLTYNGVVVIRANFSVEIV